MGVLGAVHSIRDHCNNPSERKFRIITDSHVVKELNRTFSPNYTARNILYDIRDLQLEHIAIHIVWSPEHAPEEHGNHMAHTAARERFDTPPVVSSLTPITTRLAKNNLRQGVASGCKMTPQLVY